MIEILRFRDQHVVAFAHEGEQARDVGVGEAHAAMRHGPAEQKLVIGAVEIDVALKRIIAGAAVDALLQTIEGENAGENEIVVARFPAPHLAGRLARHEHRAFFSALPDPPVHAMPAWRRAVGAFSPANAGTCARDRPHGFGRTVLDQDGTLALDIDHEQARGKLGRRAAPRERGAGKIEGTRGEAGIDGTGHGQRTLPQDARQGRTNLPAQRPG